MARVLLKVLNTRPVLCTRDDPWTLTEAPFESAEAAAANAGFPSMDDHIENTDGSGSQFAGETNLARVAGSLIRSTKARQYSAIGVAVHGKGMSDRHWRLD